MEQGFLGQPLTLWRKPASIHVSVGGVPFVVWRTVGPLGCAVPAVTTWNISADLCLPVRARVMTTAEAASAAAAAVSAQEAAEANAGSSLGVADEAISVSGAGSVQDPKSAEYKTMLKEKSKEKRRQWLQWQEWLNEQDQGGQQMVPAVVAPTRVCIPLPSSSSSSSSSSSVFTPAFGRVRAEGGQAAGSRDPSAAVAVIGGTEVGDFCSSFFSQGDPIEYGPDAENSKELKVFLGHSHRVLEASSDAFDKCSKVSPPPLSSPRPSSVKFVPPSWSSRLAPERRLSLQQDDVAYVDLESISNYQSSWLAASAVLQWSHDMSLVNQESMCNELCDMYSGNDRVEKLLYTGKTPVFSLYDGAGQGHCFSIMVMNFWTYSRFERLFYNYANTELMLFRDVLLLYTMSSVLEHQLSVHVPGAEIIDAHVMQNIRFLGLKNVGRPPNQLRFKNDGVLNRFDNAERNPTVFEVVVYLERVFQGNEYLSKDLLCLVPYIWRMMYLSWQAELHPRFYNGGTGHPVSPVLGGRLSIASDARLAANGMYSSNIHFQNLVPTVSQEVDRKVWSGSPDDAVVNHVTDILQSAAVRWSDQNSFPDDVKDCVDGVLSRIMSRGPVDHVRVGREFQERLYVACRSDNVDELCLSLRSHPRGVDCVGRNDVLGVLHQSGEYGLRGLYVLLDHCSVSVLSGLQRIYVTNPYKAWVLYARVMEAGLEPRIKCQDDFVFSKCASVLGQMHRGPVRSRSAVSELLCHRQSSVHCSFLLDEAVVGSSSQASATGVDPVVDRVMFESAAEAAQLRDFMKKGPALLKRVEYLCQIDSGQVNEGTVVGGGCGHMVTVVFFLTRM